LPYRPEGQGSFRTKTPKFWKFCPDKNGGFREILGSNIYGDYPGSSGGPLTFTGNADSGVFVRMVLDPKNFTILSGIIRAFFHPGLANLVWEGLLIKYNRLL
jgi:hypothetical protein